MNQASSQKELVLSKTKRLLRRKNAKDEPNQVGEDVTVAAGESPAATVTM